LMVYPFGLDAECKDFVSVYLNLIACARPQVRAKFKFSIMNEVNKEVQELSSDGVFRFVKGTDWGFKRFIRRDVLLDKKNQLIYNKKLTLLCEVNVVGLTASEMTTQVVYGPIRRPDSQYVDSMTTLLRSGLYTDCEINCEGRKFHVHSFMLAGRSPTFDNYFRHQMQEMITKTILLTDISAEVLEELLVYLYTDTSPRLDELATELLEAADKYELEHLKALCEDSLQRTLSPEARRNCSPWERPITPTSFEMSQWTTSTHTKTRFSSHPDGRS